MGRGDEEGIVLGRALLCCISTRGCEQPPDCGHCGVGRCQTQMKCSRQDAGGMATLGKGSYHCLAGQKLLHFPPLKGTGGQKAGIMQCLYSLNLGGRQARKHHSSAPQLPSPHCTGSCTVCMVKRFHAQAPWDLHCPIPLCDSFIQDDIYPYANATDPAHGPFAPAPLSMR